MQIQFISTLWVPCTFVWTNITEKGRGVYHRSSLNSQLEGRLDYAELRVRICMPFKEPRNRFPALRTGTTTRLFVVLASHGWWNRFLDSLNVYRFGLCLVKVRLLDQRKLRMHYSFVFYLEKSFHGLAWPLLPVASIHTYSLMHNIQI